MQRSEVKLGREFEEGGALWTKGVIEHNRRWLLAYLYAATGDSALAEDLVQETFVVAYQKREELETVPSFGAWLRGVAKNVLRRHFEKQAHQPHLISLKMLDHLERPVAALEQAYLDPEFESQRLTVLRSCVQKLTQKARALIQGRYQENLSIDELAQRTGLAAGSVPVILHRARTTLFECIRRNLSLCDDTKGELETL